MKFDNGKYCEQCGDLPEGSLTTFLEGTHWCITCSIANGLEQEKADLLYEMERVSKKHFPLWTGKSIVIDSKEEKVQIEVYDGWDVCP